MNESPQKEYWQRTWNNALANMPWKLTGTKCRAVTSGSRATLMRLLGLDIKDYTVVYNGFAHGVPPKDPEVRRKLEICAGSNGRLLAWIKLKELGIADKYEKPG